MSIELENEIKRLKQENTLLKQENEDLKRKIEVLSKVPYDGSKPVSLYEYYAKKYLEMYEEAHISRIKKIDEEIIASLVTDNLDVTVAKATKMKQTLTALRDSVSKKTKEDLTNANIDPNLSNVDPNKDDALMTFEKFSDMSVAEQEKWLEANPDGLDNL